MGKIPIIFQLGAWRCLDSQFVELKVMGEKALNFFN